MTAAIADNNVPTKTFYYNAAGSDAWLYLTTDERYIYIDSVKRIRDNVGQQIADAFLQYGDIIPDVICLGPGDCVKECIVINRITESAGGKLNDDTRLAVFLIDISLSLLSASVEHLKNNARVMCKIDIFPLCTEFERLKDHSNVTDRNRSNGLIMFGNTFGNFSNTTKIASELAAACNPGDLLVLELSLYDEITEEFLDALDMSYNIQPFKDYLGSPLRESNIDISHDEVKLRIENRDEILRQAKLGKVPKEIEVAGYYVPESNVRVGAITLPRGHERKIYTSKRFRRDYVIELMEANGFKFENEFSKGNATSFILLKYV
ncbi:MAG: L-histidine N(alpha)-methyltransferase [Defluviicoccus sp.]|nr:MAG: L-histidine N(alpha)-methyltransferase [Defluviicoccus sp.]